MCHPGSTTPQNCSCKASCLPSYNPPMKGRTHNWHSLFNSHTSTRRYWSTSKDLHTWKLCGPWMQSRGPIRGWGTPCYQYNRMKMILIRIGFTLLIHHQVIACNFPNLSLELSIHLPCFPVLFSGIFILVILVILLLLTAAISLSLLFFFVYFLSS